MASKVAVELCKLFYKTPDMTPAAAVEILIGQDLKVSEGLAAAWKRDLGSMIEALRELDAFSAPPPAAKLKVKKVRRTRRVER